MNRRKLMVGLLLLALLGILFSAGGLGPVQWAGAGVQPAEMAGAGQSAWAGGRDAYRSHGGWRDSGAARSRNAYRR